MRHSLCASALAILLAACDAAPAQDAPPINPPAIERSAEQTPGVDAISAETERLNAWFEQQYESELQYSPIQMSYLGRKDKYGQIDEISDAAEDAALDRMRASTKEMEDSFNYDLLTEEAKLSYDLWKYQLEAAEAEVEFRRHQYVFEQMTGNHTFLPTFLINIHGVETEQDFLDYISRLKESERALDQMIEASKKNAAFGVRPPLFAFEKVIDESKKVIKLPPHNDGADSSLLADAKSKVAALVEADKISSERGEELVAEAIDVLENNVKPSYARLIAWLKEDMVNADAEARGVSSLPNGEAYYARRLKASTTTDLTPDEVHQMGLAEVARIRSEMEEIKGNVGFEGSLKEFFALLRDSKDDRRLYFPDDDAGRLAYISEATAAIDRITEQLPDYFGILPKAKLEVKRVESFREQDGAAQHYVPGTPDGSRSGTYYAHLSDMTSMPRNQLEVIAYHEGNPGHHMQISIAQELEDTPTFRTQIFFGAYVEGWALYSELLAKEMGAYEDPYSDFGRLTTELWRAIRLVVDTGLHSKGWSEQQAVDYFADNSPEPLESIRSEVRRYIVLPGQATSYKIGMLKIQELRTYAETELGDAFDIREFHDVILGGGALPLDFLERRVNIWVADTKGS